MRRALSLALSDFPSWPSRSGSGWTAPRRSRPRGGRARGTATPRGPLLDWSSPSHLLHGLLSIAALWLLARRLSLAWRSLLASRVEVAWDAAESSARVIGRHRTLAVSKDRAGDAILTSASDVIRMALGFGLARRLAAWASVATLPGFEAPRVAPIRDASRATRSCASGRGTPCAPGSPRLTPRARLRGAPGPATRAEDRGGLTA